MFTFIGMLIGIMMVALAAMALLIIEECIRDHIRYRKSRNESKKGSGHTKPRDDPDTHRQVNVNNTYLAWQNHATTARMAQEAHDIAVRDSWAMHEDACHMAQQAHDTAVNDHQAAVDYHDQYVAAPDFGCSNPFV
jgi:hypothetical protein